MAILVTNQSHFKPLSFDEMIRPYQMLTDEYNKREAEISALDTKAETMRQYADNEIRANLLIEGKQINEDTINQWIKDHPNSFATQYMNYANSLDKAAEDLATKGLRGTSRKSIYDLTNQYQSNVVPIETALKTRTAKSDEQRKAHLANPDLRFDRDFSTIGLQELIDNPDLGYTTYDLNKFRTLGMQAAAAASARREQILKDPVLGNQYYKILTGYGEEEAERFIENHSTIPILERTLNDLQANVPEHLKSDIENAILVGMKTGLTQKTSYQANKNYQSDADRYRDETARIKAQADRMRAQKELMGKLPDDPQSLPSRSIVFTKDFTDVKKLLDPETGNIKFMTELVGYDGKLKKPKSNYTKPQPTSYGMSPSTDLNSASRKQYDDIKNLLMAQGITEEEFNNMHVNEVNDIIRNINEGKTDTRLKNMFVLPTLSSSATDHFMSQLKALNIIPEKITGYTKDTNSSISGKGDYSTETLKSLEDLPYKASDNDVVILGYDAANGVPIMLLNGTYYKLSSDIFDNKDRSNIEAYSSEEGQRRLKEKQQYIQDFITKYAGLSNEELLNNPDYNIDKILYDKAVSDLKAYHMWIKEFMQNPVRTSGIVNETTKAG